MQTEAEVSGKKILLVDDDPSVRESLKLMLCFDHHTVTEAADGQEALRLFSGGRYDLVITDYVLPGMRGDELTRQIKRLAPGQPVCIVTAYIEEFANGAEPADAVLGKPFGLEELRQIVGPPVLPSRHFSSTSAETATKSVCSRLTGPVDNARTLDGTAHPVKKRHPYRRWGIND